jgi:hypothetical protein
VRIQRWDVGLDGPLSEDALHRKIESLGFEIVARIYPATLAAAVPGNGRDVLVGVVRGLVKLSVDADALLLTAGDLAFIPAGCERRVEGVGPSTAVCFEAFRRLSPS